MRPLKLVMTGFESYKDRTEIDFEKLGVKGLYLITGDTGAGKTTIFDAITFALYGSPSGTDRSVEMLRSHFADEKTPTVVELDFEANGKKYHIVRNPDYERKALRGEGVTKEAANALLTFETDNREPVSGVVKVNTEVENILNLKKEQFCRIAMIAQGSFQKLLLSKKDEKEKIFRELFHTEKYEKLQFTLKSDKAAADQVVSDLNLKLQEALTRIEVCENDENADEIFKIKTSRYVKDEEIKILKNFVGKDEEILAKVLKQISDTEKKLEKVNLEIKDGETRKNLEEQIEKSAIQQKSKEEEISKLKTILTDAEEAAKKAPDLEKEKTLIEASLKDYEEIAKSEDALKKLSEEIESDEKLKASLEQKKTDFEKKIEELKSEQTSLKNAGEGIGALEAALEKISTDKKELKEIQNEIEKFSKDKTALELAQNNAKKAISDFDGANKDYAEKLRLFNLEQAGILASELSEGCACPVCGSTHHPQLAKKSEKAPTQQELENAKNTADDLQKKSTDLSVAAAEKKASVEKSESSINKLLKKYFENLTTENENVLVEIKKRDSELNVEYESVSVKLSKEQKDKNRREEIEKTLPDFELKAKNLTSELSNLMAKISGNNSKHEADSKALAKLKSGLKYETLDDAKNQFEALKNQILKLNNAVDSARENKNTCENEIANLKGGIEKLKLQIEQIQPVDLAKHESQKTDLNEKKTALNNQRDSLNERKGINQESVKKIEELVPEIAKAVERYNMISALSEVAAGSSRGKNGKPSLETYVQMHCLDQINRRANLRLKTMTENKYELRRRIEDDGSELGLDLNIKDFYTGRERNVQTLSGGEQFQASLALALGLADEVQENSGGIKLDTMFIDEGFGTLDPETLNKAMKALEELSNSNRLIGIISHVEELESRIPNKISVRKDQVGISHAEILIE